MDADSLGGKKLEEIQKFCKNQPLKFFYQKILEVDSVNAGIQKVKGWKDAAIGKKFSPKAVMEAGTMFALYRDLGMRHASRKMLWKKGLDQTMFDIVMVQSKNDGLGDK